MRANHLAVLALVVLFSSILLSSCSGSLAAGNKGSTSSTPAGPPGPSPTPTPTPTPSPTPVPSPTPTPTPGSTVLDNVQNTANWQTCGNCGNSGATGPTANYSFTPGITSPSEDGVATEFSIQPTAAYTNAYFFLEHTAAPGQINALTYEFDIYIPQGMETAPQAFEFECQQVIDDWVYNFGWQAFYNGGVWRTFDFVNTKWDATTVAFTPLSPGVWHHILVENHDDVTNHLVFHDAVTVDGVRYPVNVTHNAFNAVRRNDFSNAVQLDGNVTSTSYNVYIDRMRITYQ